jgi:hypothetical protein
LRCLQYLHTLHDPNNLLATYPSMTENLSAAVERPLPLPPHVVADLLAAHERPFLLAQIEKVNPPFNKRSKQVTYSSPNSAPLAGWTIDKIEEEYPFPYGAPGDHLWIQEEHQSGFSSHISDRGYLYRSTDVGRRSHHGVWCYENDGQFFDHYDRPFKWLPAEEMRRTACRLVVEIVSYRIRLKFEDLPGSGISNPYMWEIILKRVELPTLL